jgi:hypothetical protein
MKALSALITTLSIPLMILNMFGGIVAGIWLAILGQWSIIGIGVLIILNSTWTLGFVIMPAMLLAAPAAMFAEKRNTLGLVCFVALSNIYIHSVITLWCCGILFLFVRDATASSLIPKLLWSYCLATGPWAYMASRDAKESDSRASASMIATFLAQLGYFTIMILVIFTPITFLGAIMVFACFMTVSLVLQTTIAILLLKEMNAQRLHRDVAETVDSSYEIDS